MHDMYSCQGRLPGRWKEMGKYVRGKGECHDGGLFWSEKAGANGGAQSWRSKRRRRPSTLASPGTALAPVR